MSFSFQDEEDIFGLITGGCPLHGDEAMAECPICGAEFCRRCHPGATECPDCAGQSDGETLLDEGPMGTDEQPEDEEDETDHLLREAEALDFDETLRKELEEEELEAPIAPPAPEEDRLETPLPGPGARRSKTRGKAGSPRGGQAGGQATGTRPSAAEKKAKGKKRPSNAKKTKPRRRSR